MYLTEQFAAFLADTDYDDLPEQVVKEAKERIMDTLGAAIAGSVNWEYACLLYTSPSPRDRG